MWVDRRVHAMRYILWQWLMRWAIPLAMSRFAVPPLISIWHYRHRLVKLMSTAQNMITKLFLFSVRFFFSLAFIALWVMWTSLTHTWQIFEGCCMSFELFFFRGRTLNMNISIYINYTRKTVFNIRRVLDEELNHIQTESEKKLPTQAHVSIRLVVGGQCRKPREGERDENAKWRLYGRY